MKQYVFVIILTAAMTLALSWGVWQLSLRYKLYPGIRERDVHKTPTPRLGGVAMFLAFALIVAVSAAVPFFEKVWAQPQVPLSVLAASALIVVIGVADDVWDLDWMIKLGGQFVAAGIIAIWGGLQILWLPFGGYTVMSSWTSIALTMFAIVLVMNAINFVDGLDGLVAGVCLIANGIFFTYSYFVLRDMQASSYSSLATFLAAAVIGMCTGFLPLNWRPAKLFMGDSGALLLGLLMATSAIAFTSQLEPAMLDNDVLGQSQALGGFMPIVLPIVVVLFPLLDLGLAVLRRMGAGRSPFSPDRKHLHHRMLDLGHSHRDAVLVFYAWTAIIGIAFLLTYVAVREGWPGGYWLGIAFGLVGIVACLVVTLVPSRTEADDAERHTDPVQEHA